jgi:signal transduction histidine kinase
LGSFFYVEDDGPGIPPGKRTDVVQAGFTESEDGTGFGLSIVKQIAEGHDWRLEITEAEAGGARFEISSIERE